MCNTVPQYMVFIQVILRIWQIVPHILPHCFSRLLYVVSLRPGIIEIYLTNFWSCVGVQFNVSVPSRFGA